MDGDIAPLEQVLRLARRHDCRVLVDEAHATGAVGPGGRGSVAAAGLSGEIDVVVGTLGKALGGYGAYVCASPEIVEYLVNTARPFIFSTAPPPPAVAAAIAALELLDSHPHRVERLQANASALAESLAEEGLAPGRTESQIVPLLVGDAATTMELCERAIERGVFAQGIRPPTVAEGSSRLRLTVMATHRVAELRHAAKLIAAAAREIGLLSERPPEARRDRDAADWIELERAA
jgi:7-keto-8-aminopelargonate synthetase-like enzyme